MSERAVAFPNVLPVERSPPPAMPWGVATLLACGNLAVGAISPLYDTYVPPLLERHLASSTMVGAMMGIDNAIMLSLVPIVGVASDRTRTRLGRRMPFVLAGLPIAALALALLPFANERGLLPLVAVMILLNVALAVWRAPFSALVADLIPSPHRSLVGGLFGATMCLAAMLVLGGGRAMYERDAHLPFVLSAVLIGVVWLLHLGWLREPTSIASDGTVPGSPMRAIADVMGARDGAALRFFLACLFFHVAFQSFSSWFTTHGAARFGVSVAECSIGFIAVAVATLAGSLPAGGLGRRFGRRRVALVGILGMAVACLLAHLAPSLSWAAAALALFGVCWSLPLANLMPMAFEILSVARAGSVAAVLMLSQAIAGIIGPAALGLVFDLLGTKRPLFALLAVVLGVAFWLLRSLAAGFGEARAIRGGEPS